MNGKGVRDSRASEHVAECKSVAQASEHGQSVARASRIAIAWTERSQSVDRASPVARASPERRQSVARAPELSQNVAQASPERYPTVARASLVKYRSSRRRARPPRSRHACGVRGTALSRKTSWEPWRRRCKPLGPLGPLGACWEPLHEAHKRL